MKRKEIKRYGFTLVELLVVISIIAILLAVLMPSLNKARMLARRVVCGSQVRNISFAMSSYVQTHGSLFPVGNGWAWSDDKGRDYTLKDLKVRDDNDWAPYWAMAYTPYGVQKSMFKDSAKKKSKMYQSAGRAPSPEAIKASGFSDYTINGWVCWKDSTKTRLTQGAWPRWKGEENSRFPVEERKIVEFKRPAATILLHDGYEPVCEFNPTATNGPGDSYLRPKSNPTTYIAPANLYQWRRADADDKKFAVASYAGNNMHRGGSREYWRHNGSSVILWLDGHSSVLKETTGEDVPADWYTGGVVSEF